MENYKKHEEMIHKMTPDSITKIVIYSDILCYGPAPEVGEEIGQKLVIVSDGNIELEHRLFSRHEENEKPSESWKIDEEQIKEIFRKTYDEFLDFFKPEITDIGSWNLEVQFSNGLVMNRGCSNNLEPDGFSAFLRESLGKEDLFGCDGNQRWD